MRKTVTLFGFAASLLGSALIVDYWRPPASQSHPPCHGKRVVVDPHVVERMPETGPAKASFQMDGPVKAVGALSNAHLVANGPNEVFLKIDLSSQAAARVERPRMALAVVIDRSGSMAGDKMAQARDAAKRLVDRLEPDDQITVVSYATDYTVDLPLTPVRAASRSHIHRTIDQIYDGGGTNLSGGMEAGLRQLEKAQGKGMVSRLVLLSDGNANQGILDPMTLAQMAEESRRKGRSITSVGVGLDFNEDLMTLMAESGGGAYHYARDAHDITQVLDDEFNHLVQVMARQLELGLTLAPGVQLKEVYGYRTELRRGQVVIPVGDLVAQENRQIVVRLQVDPVQAGMFSVANVNLSYIRAIDQVTTEAHDKLTMVSTSNLNQFARGENEDVLEAVEAVLAAKARAEAVREFEAGHTGNARARLLRQVEQTRERAERLNSATLKVQAQEMESAVEKLGQFEARSMAGKDLIKREKHRARQIFVY